MTAVLRSFASALRATAPTSAGLLDGLADDLDAGGPVAELIAGHVQDPLVGVRLLAGLSLVSERTRVHVPDWAVAREAILRNEQEIRAALDRPVQQHQPERAAFLLRGLAKLGAPRVRLLELGACAGLNLVLDRYRWAGDGWTWGDESSPVRLTAFGPPPRPLEIVDRAGCDVRPLDAGNPGDALVLRSFVPPEHVQQRHNLDSALALTASLDVRVEQGSAAEWLRAQLATPADRNVHTVVWHSLLWLYLSAGEQREIEAALQEFPCPVTRIACEPATWFSPLELSAVTYWG